MASDAVEPSAGAEEEAEAAPEAPANGEEATEAGLPEMLELIDAAEEAGADACALAAVIRDIGRRIRATPGDRDSLTDFDGIANICKALAEHHAWRGEATLAFCGVMPDVCRTSTLNRATLRDEGFLVAAVELLRAAVAEVDETMALSACLALGAMCTANDGNKKVAAEHSAEKPGALTLCLSALGCFAQSPPIQAEAMCALRTLLTDDDSRKSSCEPAAIENRELALSDDGFPLLGIAVERAFAVVVESDKPEHKLHEQALLLLREMARRHEYVNALAFEAKLLSRAVAALSIENPRVVRASLSVLRAFCVSEEVRDDLGYMSDGGVKCLLAVSRHLETPVVCEQGFGLFTNLTMRKGPIAAKLNSCEPGVLALGEQVLRKHSGRPDVSRVVVTAVRNVASQDDAASQQLKESGIFELARGLVMAHEGQGGPWQSAVDAARQLLREYRADEGMEKKAVYNQFY